MDVIVCHLNADFDCLSSMLGARKIYHQAIPVFPGSQERKVREFLQTFEPLDIMKAREIDLERVTRLIIVDTKNPQRLGPFGEVALSGRVKLHIYDHHPVKEDDLRGEVEVIEDTGATATIFTEIIREKKIPLTPMDATVLCLGIYEETGSLRFPTTTERDLLAAAYLLRNGANLNIVSEYIKAELSREELRLLNELVASSRDLLLYGIRIRIVKAARDEYFGDVAHLAHRIMDMEHVDALVMLLAMEGKVVMVGRSRVPELDVAEVLGEFGGGGHPVAASATLSDEPLELIEERLVRKIKETVKPQRQAKDIMTAPVITIQWKTTIKKAESVMTRYGVNVLPVLKGEKYYGLLSREIVEKALFHGFGRSRAYEFATTDAEVTHPEAPVAEVESVMIEQNQRFMPVIEDGRVVGAITRTDLLRDLYEETLRRSRIQKEGLIERPAMGKNIAKLMTERFPNEIVALLRTAGEVADTLGCSVYLVGGSVRDLLMGERNLDIDIVVEGDGIEFARRLADRIGGVKLITHKRFNTAKIRFTEKAGLKMPAPDFTIDIATARTEYYEAPAMLPKVETSSIKKDLYRRDFTINAIAVKLNTREFGQLIDYFGAQRDLREKTIRVLHNLSFVEDPTRAFRAVRFAERFGFKINKHTENLIKSALRLNLFERVSGTRIYDELALTFRETAPVRALKSLARYGLLQVIHPGLKFTETLEETLEAVHESLAWFDLLFLEEEIDRSRVYIMGLLTGLGLEERKAALERLSTPRRDMSTILDEMEKAGEVMKELRTRDPVKIHHTLKPLSLETLLYTMAVSDDRQIKKAISVYLLELRKVKPALRGRDLMAMGIRPGPLYSKIFDAILEERLRGRIRSREEEVAFVRDFIKGGIDDERVS
ncbi:MAG: CBS domain-containing protein [Nitrospirae bacterium]|nr:CBS domain-containing protein [Nitrospirota bacterium]